MDIVIHNPQSTIRTYFVRLSIDNWRLEKRFCLCVKKIRRNRDDERVSIRRNANCVYFFAGSEEFTKGIYESIGKSSSFVARKQEIRETIKALAKADCSLPEGVWFAVRCLRWKETWHFLCHFAAITKTNNGLRLVCGLTLLLIDDNSTCLCACSQHGRVCLRTDIYTFYILTLYYVRSITTVK